MHEHSCSRIHLSRIYVHVFMDEDSTHAHGQTHKLRQYALNNQSPDRLLGRQPVTRTAAVIPAAQEGFLRCHHGPSAAADHRTSERG